MIYRKLEPMLDAWRDWVADTAHLFGNDAIVNYDEYTGIPDSITIDASPVSAIQFYVGDGTLNEWRTARYETETGFAEAKGWAE